MTRSITEICESVRRLCKNYRYIAYGIGLPLNLVKYQTFAQDNVILFSDNGILGIGEEIENQHNYDKDTAAVGRRFITEAPHACYMDASEAFSIVHGGHLDAVILGAMQVSVQGDVAGWHIPGKMLKGCGGAMDLTAGVKNVFVMMNHTTKNGLPKILTECNLPLTARKVVTKIITELGAFEPAGTKLKIIEIAANVTYDEIASLTPVPLEKIS